MKTVVLLIGFWLLLIPGFSQSFVIADDLGPLKNGDVLFQSGPSDTLQLITNLHITNSSTGPLKVLMRKQDISLLPGGNASICWAGYCYSPEMLVSTFPLDMLPGETVSGCFGHFGPHGCRGENVVRWCFFNEATPSDSISLTVHYITYPAAIDEELLSPCSLSMKGAIPARHCLNVSYAIADGWSGHLELRNLAGNVISRSEAVSLSGTHSFNTESLPSEIYLCILEVQQKPILIRKVIIQH